MCLPLVAHRADDLVEELPGAADERFALDVFLRAGGLADEHHLRVHVADAENDVVVRPLSVGTFLAGQPLRAGAQLRQPFRLRQAPGR